MKFPQKSDRTSRFISVAGKCAALMRLWCHLAGKYYQHLMGGKNEEKGLSHVCFFGEESGEESMPHLHTVGTDVPHVLQKQLAHPTKTVCTSYQNSVRRNFWRGERRAEGRGGWGLICIFGGNRRAAHPTNFCILPTILYVSYPECTAPKWLLQETSQN